MSPASKLKICPLPPAREPTADPDSAPAAPLPIQEWPIRKLKIHPKQKEFFSEMTWREMKDLADDIERNGQREPLEILPDGTIISGHQRRRALVELDWTTALVVVRHDLAQQGPAAIEQRLIEANIHRRHLTKIQLVRLYAAAKQLAQKSGQRTGRGDIRDIVAKRFNMSGRTADRLLPLLDLPIELQQAVDKKRLGANEALRLGELPPDQVEPILVMLREGRPVRIPVRKLLQRAASADDAEAAKVTKRMLRDFIRVGRKLSSRPELLIPLLKPGHAVPIRTVAELVKQLLEAVAQQPEETNQDDELIAECAALRETSPGRLRRAR